MTAAVSAAPAKRRLGWIPLLVAVAWAFALSTLGSTLTDLGPWYQALEQPRWKPPDLAFPFVWTTIFALCVFAGLIAWTEAPSRAARARVVGLFALNSALNTGWTVLFFVLKRPDWALWEVGFFWLSIGALMVAFWGYARLSSALLAVYFVWVGYAATVNWGVVALNGPFG
ncbi:MAG: TspO/MBR family protein [Maricaulaceae bacterium]